MGDNSNLAAAVTTEYNVTVPALDIPQTSPAWMQTVFPGLMQSLCNCFNDALKQMAIGVNDSMEHMQHQVNNLESIVQGNSTEIASLKETLLQKQREGREQQAVISELQQSLNKNESYSRRDNLVFRGFNLDRNDKRNCETILRQDVFIKLLLMDEQQASNIKFVRCHYMNRRPTDKYVSIIARFESFNDRFLIWNKRRSMKNIYVSEDFPLQVAKKRNKLRPILKAASKLPQYEKCISLKNDKLLFNGQLLSVDDLQNLPEPINPRTLSEVRSGDVLIFGGILSEYHELSNFYKCPITYKKKTFNCLEQGYQYAKAVLFNDIETADAILSASSPAKQKFLGSKVKGYVMQQWKTARETIMKDLLHSKFSQHPDLAKKLCSTNDLLIGESIVKDKFYGTGLSIGQKTAIDRTKWQQNKLGLMLMEERTALKAALN